METAQFKIIEGKVPVLLSAPHVFPHRRPCLNGCYKLGEPYTDSILQEACADTSCYGIYLCRECTYDPNYHKEQLNEYKKTIRHIAREGGIARFIDIHGLRDGQNFDIGLYYTTRFSKSLEFAYELQGFLNDGALRGMNIQTLRFLDNGQETLGEFAASKLRIPAVQIEIARYIREDDTLREEFVKNLITGIRKYI